MFVLGFLSNPILVHIVVTVQGKHHSQGLPITPEPHDVEEEFCNLVLCQLDTHTDTKHAANLLDPILYCEMTNQRSLNKHWVALYSWKTQNSFS